MKILAIDTSCDETAAAVTEGTKVLSNIIWSQAAAHAKFGGVMPSLAQRMHEERIDWVIERAIKSSKRATGSAIKMQSLDAIAVTIGPGLSIALGVGIDRAKRLAKKYNKPLIPINHVEAHILSPLANSNDEMQFPAYGLCVSGGNTIFVLIEKEGYKILAETQDDALGEALDKGARMLGLGYPGGAVLEKMAKLGNPKRFTLPIPLVGQEKRQIFSYSGLKTSFYRLIQSSPPKTKQDTYDLAAAYQDIAFKHIERVLEYSMTNNKLKIDSKADYVNLLVGGGVAANIELRKRLRKLSKKHGVRVSVPYSEKLYGDNAAMIGVCAGFKISAGEVKPSDLFDYDKIDRNPRLKINQ